MLKILSNPYQNGNNFMKMTQEAQGCCPSKRKSGIRKITVAKLSDIFGIVFEFFTVEKGAVNGPHRHQVLIPEDKRTESGIVEHLISLAEEAVYVPLTSQPLAKQALSIACSGFGAKQCGPGEIVTLEKDGSNFVLSFATDFDIVGYLGDEGVVTEEVETLCEKVQICEVRFPVEKEGTIEVANSETGDSVIIGPFADEEEVVTQINTGLPVIGINVEAVETKATVKEGFCLVHIKTTDSNALTFNGTVGENCGCVESWVSDEKEKESAERLKFLKAAAFGGKGSIVALPVAKIK